MLTETIMWICERDGSMKKCLSQEWLKFIACVTMLIDHIGAVLLPQYVWLRYIGRIAFPIYCFLLAEGVHHTSNPKKYGLRLGIDALLSEIPFDLALFGGVTPYYQSVMLTLLIAFAMALCMKRTTNIILQVLLVIPFAMIAEWLRTDYGGMGVVLVAVFVLSRDLPYKPLIQGICMAPILWMMEGMWVDMAGIWLPVEMLALVSMVPIGLYSGRKSATGRGVQTAFYLFYPVHLMILFVVSMI